MPRDKVDHQLLVESTEEWYREWHIKMLESRMHALLDLVAELKDQLLEMEAKRLSEVDRWEGDAPDAIDWD